MTVKELIDHLSKLDPNALVYAFDADSEAPQEVTGIDISADGSSVELQTDAIERLAGGEE